MGPCAFIFKESTVPLWGLSSRRRLERVLRRAGITDFTEDPGTVPAGTTVLLIRGDYLYDDRVINALVETPGLLLTTDPAGEGTAVAAHVPAELALQALSVLKETSGGISLPGVRTEGPDTLCPSYQERLRKSDPPFVLPVTPGNRRELEQRLFSWSYKGVTDLVTKWVWPRPAMWCTRICARYGIRPNSVTLVGLILVIIAGLFFARGRFGWGLLAGWLMTFLDTVDGKLARVTVTSSKFGHLFDHIIDLVHPPIWYVVWGFGLSPAQADALGWPLQAVLWLIVIGYAAGRFVEAAFTLWVGRFGIFSWRPVDSYFRLVTGRRNPNLILLTAGVLAGHPEAGLLAVALWTGLTSLFLLLRLAMAVATRIGSGPLRSWLSDIDRGIYDGTLAVRLFGGRPMGRAGDRNA